MDKITKFVECLVPISKCNLRCSYCYVIQEDRRDSSTNPFRLSPDKIGEAFSKDRWGGLMLVNLCGFGETFIPNQFPKIIANIIRQGHYVSVTTNGTLTDRIKETIELISLPEHLCFAFSLHYIELKNRNLLDVFANNVKMVKDAGCSYLIQLNLADEYISCIDEIKDFCTQHFGHWPQVALTRKEGEDYSIFTNYSEDEYYKYGNSFNSPLFDFTYKNFRVKRTEFCYAGKWSFKLDLATGELRSCYFSKSYFNIYDDVNEDIKYETVGNNCGCAYCINASHFLSLGVIPSLCCPTYAQLRDPECQTYTNEMRCFLNQKLGDNNEEYNAIERMGINARYVVKKIVRKIERLYCWATNCERQRRRAV